MQKIRAAKILLITNIPTPYRIPLFNEIDRQLRDAGLAFKVAFAMPGYRRRKWEIDLSDCKFEYAFLSDSKALRLSEERTIFTYGGFLGLLKKERPIVTVVTGFSIATTKLWLRQFWRKTPYIIWSGAIIGPGHTVSKLRTWHRRALVGGAEGFIAYGSRAKDYLISLGAKEDAVHVAMNTVDTAFFVEETERLRGQTRQGALDSKKHILLSIGYFVSRKRFDSLLWAARDLSKYRDDFVLCLVGDGPESDNLRALARQLEIEPYVRFEGFRQKRELPRYLARASCFLFSSERDIWGLTLVEAMASGVPCLASPRPGATKDLIVDGETGYILDFSDPATVADRIDWVLSHREEALRMGAAGRSFIQQRASLFRSARGFLDAILACSSMSGSSLPPERTF